VETGKYEVESGACILRRAQIPFLTFWAAKLGAQNIGRT